MKFSRSAIRLSVMMFIAAGIFSCTSKTGSGKLHTGVEYYRSLQFSETPYDTEKGVHPLTADQAKTINNYKFTYDDSGRLLSVEFGSINVLLGYSSMDGAAKIVYEYVGNKQIRHLFNKANEPIESSGVSKEEYTLDANGIRTGLKFYGKGDSPVENENKIYS